MGSILEWVLTISLLYLYAGELLLSEKGRRVRLAGLVYESLLVNFPGEIHLQNGVSSR
jgi:hypothetical protein